MGIIPILTSYLPCAIRGMRVDVDENKVYALVQSYDSRIEKDNPKV